MMTQLRRSPALFAPRRRPSNSIIVWFFREIPMHNFKMPRGALALALGVPLLLAGCATRSSVEQAQNSANMADQHAGAADSHAANADSHAGAAQARADEAYGVGNNAMTAAQTADQKASDAQTGLSKANARISYLERHLMPKHFKVHHVMHHKKKPAKPSGT
jgi:murein lipoprotein